MSTTVFSEKEMPTGFVAPCFCKGKLFKKIYCFNDYSLYALHVEVTGFTLKQHTWFLLF